MGRAPGLRGISPSHQGPGRPGLRPSKLATETLLRRPLSGAATATLGQLGASGLDPAQSLATINRLVDQQAFTLSVDDLFFVSAMLFLLLLVLVWAAKPAKGAGVDAAGAH